MSDAPLDIDAIVREVLRRLRADAPSTNGPSQTAVAPDDAPAAAKPGELVWSEKVVSWSQLQDRLKGVRHIIVPRGAVVTPSVRDELRRRNVSLSYQCAPAQSASSSNVLLVIVESCCEAGQLIGALDATAGAQLFEASSLRQATQAVVRHLTCSDNCAVVLTTAPAATACVMNRTHSARAAVASSDDSVREAVQTLGANVLAVNPSGNGLYAVRRWVLDFVRSGPKTCPVALQKVLTAP
jgi:hypothetical protein